MHERGKEGREEGERGGGKRERGRGRERERERGEGQCFIRCKTW